MSQPPGEVQVATLSQGSRTFETGTVVETRETGSIISTIWEDVITERHPNQGGPPDSQRHSVGRSATFSTSQGGSHGGSACPDVQIFNAHIRADRLPRARHRSTLSEAVGEQVLVFADMPGRTGLKNILPAAVKATNTGVGRDNSNS